MPLPISVSNTFAGATSAIPLSQLDANFTTVVNGVNGIGNGTNSLANVSITGGSISNVSVSSSNVTITGGTLNGVSITNATAFTSGNVTITAGTINNTSVTNAVTITSANIAVTGGTMSNVTITGGSINNASITNASTLTSSNVTIRGGTINNTSVTNAITLTSSNVTITGGSISNVTLSNVATAPTNGFLRNRVINGAMQVDQRNNGAVVSLAASAQTYVLDRWFVHVALSNFGSLNVARIGTSPAGGPDNQYMIKLSGSTSAVDYAGSLVQRIEQLNCYDLANKTVTLSFDGASGSGTKSTTVTLSYANTVNTFGTFASPTKTTIGTAVFNLSSAVQTFTASFSIPAAATTGIEIAFFVSDASLNDNFSFGSVQLEAGGTATPFERRSFGETLALCSRYYQKLGAYVPAAQAMFSFPTVMRVAPTVAGGGTGYSSPNIYTNGVSHSQTTAGSQTAMTFTSEL